MKASKSDIAILREVIVKLTQMLTGQGLKVTQHGTNAYVQTDLRTFKPILINIPYVPDDASETLLFAVQGFIDHEVAHVLHTDWSAVKEAAGESEHLKVLHNIVEDTFIERAICKTFPGSAYNLKRMHGFFVTDISDAALAKVPEHDLENQFNIILVPLMRALSGQTVFDEWMTDRGYWKHKLVAAFMDAFTEEHREKLRTIKNSHEALAIARVVMEILNPPKKGEGGGGEDSSGSDEVGEETEESTAGEAMKGGESGSKPTDMDAEASDEMSDSEPSPFEGYDFKPADFDGEIAKKISADTVKATRDAPYRVFTKDFDRVETYEPKFPERVSPNDLEDKVRTMVGVMSKDIERMMASRSLAVQVPGFRSGRLHSGGLHRLIAGDDRIFRRKQIAPSKDTVVSLLIDNSGSMSSSKMSVAMAAGFALSMTLDRVGISHECLGFTTTNKGARTLSEMVRDETRRTGIKYSRWEPIYMPIFKGFDERFTPQIKIRFADASAGGMGLLENIDGECVEIAARRLINRPQRRKVLIVLSDGSPACKTDDWHGLRNHLHTAVKDAEKHGVETIGIGILDRSVSTFYPKHVVLDKLEALPATIMGQLKGILAA